MADSQDPSRTQFEQQAEGAPPGLLRELWDFLKQNKKWWLLPILAVLLLLGLAVMVGGGSLVAPFLYPLF